MGVGGAIYGETVAGSREDIDGIISRHLTELAVTGVLSVRPGYALRDGWITEERAVVVTVRDGGHATLPAELDGVPVDVRRASPAKLERLENPAAYARTRLPFPDARTVPEFPDERDLVDGSRVPLLDFFAEAEKAKKPQLPYTTPDGVALAPVSGEITITLSASPDNGWSTLGPFLDATRSSLTVGMYDFTSRHVLDRVESALADRTVKLVLDHPARNPTADQSDEETVTALKGSLKHLTQAWALDRMDPLASAWIFPTAYHIKVAVRDGSVFWLSSGNWNNSNQPDIDPVNDQTDAAAARSGDRDWHVVVEHAGLSRVFERYLLNDLEAASAHDQAGEPADLALLAPPLARTPPFASFVPAKTITARMTLTPLLTPDPGVYTAAVKGLIAGATKSLHLQFQYIKLPAKPDGTTEAFIDLVDAVIDRQRAGVDVKIVMSQYETAGYLEQLQEAGLDVVHGVRLQNNVHNKGIVVDGARVLVSSQNWSGDGVLHNRDAGVIIDSVEAAAYFDQLFQHDWDHLATQKAHTD